MPWSSRLPALALLLLLALTPTACADVSLNTPEPVTLTIAGSTTMRPVLRELADAFSRQYPEVLFDLRGGGSALGEEQARTGVVTLGASTLLPPTDLEGTPAPDPLQRVPIGLDGLAIIVHASNPTPNLTLLNLRDLYAGNVLDWVQVGGSAGEILLVSREEGSGSRVTFESRVMGDEAVSLTAVVMPTAADVVAYVAETPSAIGYVSRAYVRELLDGSSSSDGTTGPTGGVRVVPVEGALPTIENIARQSYFLIQPLFLVSATAPAGRTRQFLDFAVGPVGQEVVARYHAPVR